MRHKLAVIGLATGVLVVAFGMIAPNLGSEFVPRLSEGAIAIGVVRLAGTDLDESIRYNTEMERAILDTFPDEVDHVWSRIGSAEVATDPMGVELTDMFVTLKPRSQWTQAPHAGRVHRAARQNAARPAGPAAGLFAADRNADERDGFGRAGRFGRQAVRRRFRRAGGKGRRDRSRPAFHSRRGRRQRRADHRPAGAANQSEPGADRPLRRVGRDGARPGRIDRLQAAGRNRRRATPLSARRCGCPRRCAKAPRRSARCWWPRPRASGFRCRDWPRSKWSRAPRRSRGSGTSGGSP